MGASTIGGLPFPPATGQVPRVNESIEDLTTALDPQIVARADNVAGRTSAYAGVLAADRAGSVCWVRDRTGHSYFNGTAWKWIPQRNLIFDGYRASAVETAISTAGTMGVEMTVPYTLPPGNRQLHVAWGSQVQNISTPANRVVPRVEPLGAGGSNIGIPDGRNWAQASMPVETAGTGFVTTVFNEAWPILSGNVQIKLFGLSAAGAASGTNAANLVRFLHTWMIIFDLGPTDD